MYASIKVYVNYIYICCFWHYINCLLSYFLTYLFPYLFTSLWIGPFCFQARGNKRQLNLALVFVFVFAVRRYWRRHYVFRQSRSFIRPFICSTGYVKYISLVCLLGMLNNQFAIHDVCASRFHSRKYAVFHLMLQHQRLYRRTMQTTEMEEVHSTLLNSSHS